MLLLAAIVSIHKPLLSGVYDVTATHDVTATPDASTEKTPTADGVTPTDMTYRPSERTYDVESWTWIAASDDDDVAAMLMTSSEDTRVCGRNPAYSWSSFITEIIYGLSITVVPFVPIVGVSPAHDDVRGCRDVTRGFPRHPFVPITVLNAAILRALVTRDRLTASGTATAEVSSTGAGGSGSRPRYKTVEKRVRREFTVILLVICASVLCLSLPYFVVWCRQYLQSRHV